VGHVTEHCDWARRLGVEVLLVPYDGLAVFFNGAEGYNFNNMKFDVIVGNPPFQPPSQKGNGSGSRSMIWQRFIELAFKLAKNDGHLLFITPHNWRTGGMGKGGPFRVARDLMWKHGIRWYIDTREPIDYFPLIGSAIHIDAWHIMMNGPTSAFPCSLVQARLLPCDALALVIFDKYFSACNGDCINVKMARDNGDSEIRDAMTGGSSCGYRLAVTAAKVKKGLFNWRAVKPASYDKKKVIVSDTGSLSPWYDDGTCGVDAGGFAEVVSQKHGMTLVDFLNSPIATFMMKKLISGGAMRVPLHIFNNIPSSIIDHVWTGDAWKHSTREVFNITDEDIKYIETI
jgi:hypothetical protein